MDMKAFYKTALQYFIISTIGVVLSLFYLEYRNLDSSSPSTNTEISGNYEQYFDHKNGSLIVLGTSWCSSCKNLHKYLIKNNVEYTSYDIENDEIGKNLFIKLEESVIPIIITKDMMYRGLPNNKKLKLLITKIGR
ncbi:MAG: hypothetical protein COB38_10580 [Gammaproteobacteria bacterium]|nr:MAG: hypothetical protein COB38_10580 [Gammaproteobacteria bacterium]